MGRRNRKRDKRRLKGGNGAKQRRQQAAVVVAVLAGEQVSTCQECGLTFVGSVWSTAYVRHLKYSRERQAWVCKEQLLKTPDWKLCACNHYAAKHKDKAGNCTKCRCLHFYPMNRR